MSVTSEELEKYEESLREQLSRDEDEAVTIARQRFLKDLDLMKRQLVCPSCRRWLGASFSNTSAATMTTTSRGGGGGLSFAPSYASSDATATAAQRAASPLGPSNAAAATAIGPPIGRQRGGGHRGNGPTMPSSSSTAMLTNSKMSGSMSVGSSRRVTAVMMEGSAVDAATSSSRTPSYVLCLSCPDCTFLCHQCYALQHMEEVPVIAHHLDEARELLSKSALELKRHRTTLSSHRGGSGSTAEGGGRGARGGAGGGGALFASAAEAAKRLLSAKGGPVSSTAAEQQSGGGGVSPNVSPALRATSRPTRHHAITRRPRSNSRRVSPTEPNAPSTEFPTTAAHSPPPAPPQDRDNNTAVPPRQSPQHEEGKAEGLPTTAGGGATTNDAADLQQDQLWSAIHHLLCAPCDDSWGALIPSVAGEGASLSHHHNNNHRSNPSHPLLQSIFLGEKCGQSGGAGGGGGAFAGAMSEDSSSVAETVRSAAGDHHHQNHSPNTTTTGGGGGAMQALFEPHVCLEMTTLDPAVAKAIQEEARSWCAVSMQFFPAPPSSTSSKVTTVVEGVSQHNPSSLEPQRRSSLRSCSSLVGGMGNSTLTPTNATANNHGGSPTTAATTAALGTFFELSHAYTTLTALFTRETACRLEVVQSEHAARFLALSLLTTNTAHQQFLQAEQMRKRSKESDEAAALPPEIQFEICVMQPFSLPQETETSHTANDTLLDDGQDAVREAGHLERDVPEPLPRQGAAERESEPLVAATNDVPVGRSTVSSTLPSLSDALFRLVRTNKKELRALGREAARAASRKRRYRRDRRRAQAAQQRHATDLLYGAQDSVSSDSSSVRSTSSSSSSSSEDGQENEEVVHTHRSAHSSQLSARSKQKTPAATSSPRRHPQHHSPSHHHHHHHQSATSPAQRAGHSSNPHHHTALSPHPSIPTEPRDVEVVLYCDQFYLQFLVEQERFLEAQIREDERAGWALLTSTHQLQTQCWKAYFMLTQQEHRRRVTLFEGLPLRVLRQFGEELWEREWNRPLSLYAGQWIDFFVTRQLDGRREREAAERYLQMRDQDAESSSTTTATTSPKAFEALGAFRESGAFSKGRLSVVGAGGPTTTTTATRGGGGGRRASISPSHAEVDVVAEEDPLSLSGSLQPSPGRRGSSAPRRGSTSGDPSAGLSNTPPDARRRSTAGAGSSASGAAGIALRAAQHHRLSVVMEGGGLAAGARSPPISDSPAQLLIPRADDEPIEQELLPILREIYTNLHPEEYQFEMFTETTDWVDPETVLTNLHPDDLYDLLLNVSELREHLFEESLDRRAIKEEEQSAAEDLFAALHEAYHHAELQLAVSRTYLPQKQFQTSQQWRSFVVGLVPIYESMLLERIALLSQEWDWAMELMLLDAQIELSACEQVFQDERLERGHLWIASQGDVWASTLRSYHRVLLRDFARLCVQWTPEQERLTRHALERQMTNHWRSITTQFVQSTRLDEPTLFKQFAAYEAHMTDLKRRQENRTTLFIKSIGGGGGTSSAVATSTTVSAYGSPYVLCPAWTDPVRRQLSLVWDPQYGPTKKKALTVAQGVASRGLRPRSGTFRGAPPSARPTSALPPPPTAAADEGSANSSPPRSAIAVTRFVEDGPQPLVTALSILTSLSPLPSYPSQQKGGRVQQWFTYTRLVEDVAVWTSICEEGQQLIASYRQKDAFQELFLVYEDSVSRRASVKWASMLMSRERERLAVMEATMGAQRVRAAPVKAAMPSFMSATQGSQRQTEDAGKKKGRKGRALSEAGSIVSADNESVAPSAFGGATATSSSLKQTPNGTTRNGSANRRSGGGGERAGQTAPLDAKFTPGQTEAFTTARRPLLDQYGQPVQLADLSTAVLRNYPMTESKFGVPFMFGESLSMTNQPWRPNPQVLERLRQFTEADDPMLEDATVPGESVEEFFESGGRLRGLVGAARLQRRRLQKEEEVGGDADAGGGGEEENEDDDEFGSDSNFDEEVVASRRIGGFSSYARPTSASLSRRSAKFVDVKAAEEKARAEAETASRLQHERRRDELAQQRQNRQQQQQQQEEGQLQKLAAQDSGTPRSNASSSSLHDSHKGAPRGAAAVTGRSKSPNTKRLSFNFESQPAHLSVSALIDPEPSM